jgi:hypothetical protein
VKHSSSVCPRPLHPFSSLQQRHVLLSFLRISVFNTIGLSDVLGSDLSFFHLFDFSVVLEHIALSFVRYRHNCIFRLCEDSRQECYNMVEGLKEELQLFLYPIHLFLLDVDQSCFPRTVQILTWSLLTSRRRQW